MNAENSESRLISEFQQLLGEAFLEVEGESRLDVDYEVAETIRYEQGHVSWRDRARNSRAEIEIMVAHPGLPRVSGTLSHLSTDFLILKNDYEQYLINTSAISSIQGLSNLANLENRFDAISWLEGVWFHDLIDRCVPVTWYLIGGQTISGVCVRSGFDAIDIAERDTQFTIPKAAIVAAKVR